jgi:hypothetical protein
VNQPRYLVAETLLLNARHVQNVRYTNGLGIKQLSEIMCSVHNDFKVGTSSNVEERMSSAAEHSSTTSVGNSRPGGETSSSCM